MQAKLDLCEFCGRLAGPPGSKCRDHVAPAGKRVFVRLESDSLPAETS